MIISDILWFAAVALGPLALAAAIIYAIFRRRRLTRSERERQKRGVRHLYKDEP
ncbi:hypothetical protein [Roseibium salinum]|uniref:Secreted protein with PEP-CTERM sorting signal n=1 Tax=Roseibium salinum TaxID=1604349 RepID=A0ABT3QXB9_9HYPH|nr:hypothetical protein [Roseibium sp. DSM 29163]MCX2721555.1 hypothetical protein [Roseibium sp. DSM 29163]MDN3722029.1 hypothetical protein [Roseibium salinum]